MKQFLLALALSVLPVALMAETHYKPRISVGGKAGVSLAMMSFSPSVKQSWNMGTAGAVTFRYTEEKLFGLVAELGWVQRGWKENFEEHPFAYSRSLTYINLPILTHIYFGSRRFKTFINLGTDCLYDRQFYQLRLRLREPLVRYELSIEQTDRANARRNKK